MVTGALTDAMCIGSLDHVVKFTLPPPLSGKISKAKLELLEINMLGPWGSTIR